MAGLLSPTGDSDSEGQDADMYDSFFDPRPEDGGAADKFDDRDLGGVDPQDEEEAEDSLEENGFDGGCTADHPHLASHHSMAEALRWLMQVWLLATYPFCMCRTTLP